MFELTQLLKNNQLPHALLIVDGKARARAFAKELVQTTKEFHPDIHEIKPEGELHHIAALRTLIEDISLTPYEAAYKVFIIEKAECMQPAQANALLKILEEPPKQSLILLLTDNPDRILPTLRSRCQIYYFHESKEDRARLTALFEALAGRGEYPQEETIEPFIFEAIMKWHRDLYIVHLGLPDALLFYPECKNDYLSQQPQPLDELERRVRKAMLAASRQLKFPYIMQSCVLL